WVNLILLRIQVTLEPDRPSLRVLLSHTTSLCCCYSATGGAVETTWFISIYTVNGTGAPKGVDRRDNRVTVDGGNLTAAGVMCEALTVSIHVTFLQVLCQLGEKVTTVGAIIRKWKKHKRTWANIQNQQGIKYFFPSLYDQIQRSLVQGPYQDVGNMIIEEEIQLEKP
uniref:Uncharacterized protein n=1 Tax=Hucho hucho TaxID=62062 RepID=A0A4W5ME16_9TELE